MLLYVNRAAVAFRPFWGLLGWLGAHGAALHDMERVVVHEQRSARLRQITAFLTFPRDEPAPLLHLEAATLFRDVNAGLPHGEMAIVNVGFLPRPWRQHPELRVGSAVWVELPQLGWCPQPVAQATARALTLVRDLTGTRWESEAWDRGKGAYLSEADFAFRYRILLEAKEGGAPEGGAAAMPAAPEYRYLKVVHFRATAKFDGGKSTGGEVGWSDVVGDLDPSTFAGAVADRVERMWADVRAGEETGVYPPDGPLLAAAARAAVREAAEESGRVIDSMRHDGKVECSSETTRYDFVFVVTAWHAATRVPDRHRLPCVGDAEGTFNHVVVSAPRKGGVRGEAFAGRGPVPASPVLPPDGLTVVPSAFTQACVAVQQGVPCNRVAVTCGPPGGGRTAPVTVCHVCQASASRRWGR